MARPKISVCMATYNGMPFLRSQLASIFGQLDKNDEVLVSDDGSTDGTVPYLASIDDPRFRVLPSRGFRHPAKNFEYAISESRNKLVFLADQDDEWASTKVDTLIECLADADAVVSDCELIDDNGLLVKESFFGGSTPRTGLVRNIISNNYVGCCMAFNRRLLNVALPFPNRIPMHDWWIGVVAEACGRTLFMPDRLVRYRRHAGSFSATGTKSRLSMWTKLMHRTTIIFSLIARTPRIATYRRSQIKPT